MNKADIERITTTGEIRTDEKCPCCGDGIHDCSCELLIFTMGNPGWVCMEHRNENGDYKQGEWG